MAAMLRSAAARRPAMLATVSSSFSNASHASRSSPSFSCLVLNREHSHDLLMREQRRQISSFVTSSTSSNAPVILAVNDGQQSNHKNNSRGGGGGSGNFGRGGNNNHRSNHEVPTCAYISALAAIMGLYVLSHIDDEAEHAVISTETNWVDLLQLVHENMVERIVITDNNSVARIYVLEENSKEYGKEKATIRAQKLSEGQKISKNGIDVDATQVQFGDAKPNNNGESTKESRTPWISSNFHHDGIEAPSKSSIEPRKVYHLSIDASFEEKLEEAQRKCGRNRTNFIPVEYRPSHTTDESPVLTAAARIAVIGVVSGMIRIVTKQPGAGLGSSAELGSSLGIIANSSLGTSLAQLRRMKALGVAMVPLLTRLPSSWTKAQPNNSWRSVFTYSRK